jgi:hypothetical protein
MREAVDSIRKGIQIEAKAIRKVWSLMEAATQKTRPSEIMSREAKRRLQGRKVKG